MPFRDRLNFFAGSGRSPGGDSGSARPAAKRRTALPVDPAIAPLAAALSLLLLLWQSVEVSESYGRLLSSPLWLAPLAAWTGLFLLLGRSVGDARRDALPPRSAARAAARLVIPAWLAVLLPLFVLGPLLTMSTVGNYFADPRSWSYLSNLVAWPQLSLPGVFEFNNASRVVNPAVALFPAGAATLVFGWFGPRTGRLRFALPVAIAGAALAAVAFVPSTDTDSFRFALAAAAAGQIGLLSSLWTRSLRRRGLIFAALVAGAGVAGIAGWIRPELQAILAVPIIAAAAGVTLLAMTTALPHWLRSWPRFIRPWPALVLSFPIQQVLAQAGGGLSGPLAIAAVSVPVSLGAGWSLAWVLRLAGLGGDHPRAGQPVAAPVRAAEARFGWRRRDVELAVIVGLIIVVMIAILALIGFAMQRRPWEN